MFMLTDNNDVNYGLFESQDAAYDEIKKRIKLLNFEVYYYRQNMLDDRTVWIDYGSHTHFFYLRKYDPASIHNQLF